MGLPRWRSGKESACQYRRYRRHGFDAWVGKIPWRRKWQLTPVFLPGKFHGQRSLVDYSPWNCRVRHDWARTRTHTPVYTMLAPCGTAFGKQPSVDSYGPVLRAVLRKKLWNSKVLSIYYTILSLWFYLIFLVFILISWFLKILLAYFFQCIFADCFEVEGYIFEGEGKEGNCKKDGSAKICKQCTVLDFRLDLLHFSKELLFDRFT